MLNQTLTVLFLLLPSALYLLTGSALSFLALLPAIAFIGSLFLRISEPHTQRLRQAEDRLEAAEKRMDKLDSDMAKVNFARMGQR